MAEFPSNPVDDINPVLENADSTQFPRSNTNIPHRNRVRHRGNRENASQPYLGRGTFDSKISRSDHYSYSTDYGKDAIRQHPDSKMENVRKENRNSSRQFDQNCKPEWSAPNYVHSSRNNRHYHSDNIVECEYRSSGASPTSSREDKSGSNGKHFPSSNWSQKNKNSSSRPKKDFDSHAEHSNKPLHGYKFNPGQNNAHDCFAEPDRKYYAPRSRKGNARHNFSTQSFGNKDNFFAALQEQGNQSYESAANQNCRGARAKNGGVRPSSNLNNYSKYSNDSKYRNSTKQFYGEEQEFQRYSDYSKSNVKKNPKQQPKHSMSPSRNGCETKPDFDARTKGSNGKQKYRRNDAYSQQANVDCLQTNLGDEDATYRDRLIDQLRNSDYECMVCCEHVLVRDAIWSCTGCFHIFHLKCIYKWAKSPAAVVENSGWRCPACQQTTSTLPNHYFCFCGKVEKPSWNPYEIPHSCGNVCGKKSLRGDCPHRCTLLCHPGPCPPCSVSLRKKCQCGSTFKYVRCSQEASVVCDNKCNKMLECSLHTCPKQCHVGKCDDCEVTSMQTCFCGKEERAVRCTSETSGVSFYSCASACRKKLLCGEHVCKRQCHYGECGPCGLSPGRVSCCPCGKTPIFQLEKSKDLKPRKKCTDPIPTCDNLCLLPLTCGPENNPHRCALPCHPPPCPPCPGKTLVKCRCKGQTNEVRCASLADFSEFLCERRCNKKKMCGRHKCLNTCCVDENHPCALTCNRKLSCGLHFCQERCHNGKCPPCWNVGFEDLTCRCGSSVLYPPIPCGTRPPECDRPCSREHSCDHPVHHVCHSDDKCPPCTVLVEKWCFGEHELRPNVPCHLAGLSCGKTCNKPLPCGTHTCQQVCHKGPCTKEDATCTQPCKTERPDCGHPCGAPCHRGPCPDGPCKFLITATCACGQRSETVPCGESSSLYNRVSAPLLARKMQKIQSGQTVDISDVITSSKTNKHGKVDCNEQCASIERNRRLALALQIRNPDLSTKPGPPNYSDFLREETKKNLPFVTSAYEQLAELVQSAKKGKFKLRTLSFQPMNREHRRVIHELAEYFGCKTESVDLEPKRSVEVTAFRDKSWLPSVSVMTVVQRHLGQRKGPTPVVSAEKKKESAEPVSASLVKDEEKEVIDYFNFG